MSMGSVNKDQLPKEYNSLGSEYQVFDACEYYKVNEHSNFQNEIFKTPEYQRNSQESSLDMPEDVSDPLNQNDDNNSDRFRNTADGSKSPDMNSNQGNSDVSGSGASDSSSMAAEEEAAISGSASASSASASSASASATVTAASVAGSASVVAIAAVGIVAVATGAFTTTPPKIVSETYESGTDYLTYEIDLAELDKNVEYKIRVQGPNFVAEYPVIEAGVQKQLVTDLQAYRKYTVEVVGKLPDIDSEAVFYTHPVYTEKLEKPQAVFEFIPQFDYLNGTVDIVYNTYISDFYKTGYNTYFQVYIGKDLVVDDHNLGEDSFFHGVIEGLTDLTYLEATVYTTYYEELIEVGKYGYRPDYPEDFNVTPKYESTYDVKIPTVTYAETGYSLSIDTGFTATSDEDSYIIDIYKGEEKSETNLNAEEKVLLASYEGRDKIFNVEIPGNINNIDVYFTGVKTRNEKKTLFESKKIYSYSFSEDKKKAPEPTAVVEFTEDYDPVDDIYNVDYSVNVTDIFNTGSNYKIVEMIDNEIINEITLDKLEYKSSFNTLANGVDISVIVYCNYNDDKEQIVIGSDEKKIEYPEPFKDFEYFFTETSYGFSFKYAKEEANKTFNLNIIQNNNDKTTAEHDFEFVDICEYTNTLANINLSDIESFNLTITYNDNTIKKLVVYPDGSTIEFSDVDADEDGNIIVPYEINIPEGGEFVSGTISFEGIEDGFEITELKGSIKITSFDSNILRPKTNIKYNLDDAVINREIVSSDINVGALYEVSYYASHYDSYYNYMNIKFEPKLNDKNVNINLNPMIIESNDEALEFVKITDRNIEGFDETTHRDYYVVKMTYITQDDFGISYKITNEGFDNEEHTIIARNSIEANYDFTAGHIDNSTYVIDYCKTINEDGTVNYYFDTKASGFDENHFGRIEYSYLDGETLKYAYTDYFNTRTFSILNLKDIEYDFSYAIYQKVDDLYYDLNVSQTSNEKEFKAKEIKIVALDVNTDTTTIAKLDYQDEERSDMVIDFVLERANVDESKPITVTYDNTEYNITIPTENSSDAPLIEDEETGGVGINGDWASDDGSYGYRVYVTDETLKIEVYKDVSTIDGDIPNTATVKYTAIANEFLNAFENGLQGEYELSGEIEKTIGEYTGKLNYENIEYEFTNPTLESRGTITVKGIEYSYVDDRDRLDVVAYCNGEEVMTEMVVSGEDIVLEIDPAYTNIELKLKKYKNQYVEAIGNYDTMTMKELVYEIIDLEKTIEFDNIQIIDNIELIEDVEVYGISVTYSNQIMTFDDYRMEVLYYYENDGEPFTDTINDLEYGISEARVSKHETETPIKMVVNIYKNANNHNKLSDILYDTYEIPLTANITFGTVDVNDDGFVILPYEIIVPENATLLTSADGDYANTVQMSGLEDIYNLDYQTGNITIKELESNILAPIADLYYKLNNAVINHRVLCVEKELDAEYEVSYYASHVDSFYTTLNIKVDAKIDGKSVNMPVYPLVTQENIETDEIEFVRVNDENRNTSDEKQYNDYYIVKGIYDSENDDYYVKYKLDENDAETTIRFNEPEGDKYGFSAGNGDSYVDYVVTKNQDGTVNYYFNTYLESENNHYGRIEYSYVVDGITRYLYSDYFTGSTYSITNIPNREYTFKYAVYFKIGDMYYDLNTREYGQDLYFRCKENSSAAALNLDNAVIAQKAGTDDDRNPIVDTLIDFTIVETNLVKGDENPIVVTYNGEAITIPFKEYDANDTNMASLDNVGYQYYWQSDDEKTKYVVKVYNGDVSFEVIKRTIGKTAPLTATVSFTGCTNAFISSYTTAHGENDIINSESLTNAVEVTVGDYTGTYDIEKFTDDFSNNGGDYKNSVYIYTSNGFSSTDSRDKLMGVAYYDGVEVGRAISNYNGTIEIQVDPAYTKIDVKIVKVKEQSIESISNLLEMSSYTIEYDYPGEDYKSFTFDQVSLVSDVGLSKNGDGHFVLTVTPTDQDGFSNYYIKAEHYYAGQAAATIYTGEAGDTSVEIAQHVDDTTKIILNIYNSSDLLVNRYELDMNPTIDDYTYVDESDYIDLPYEFNLQTGAVLSSHSTWSVENNGSGNLNSNNGIIRISSLQSNIIDIDFNVEYTLGETTVTYSFTKSHEINSDNINFDYAIYSVLGNSSYGDFSRMDVKYDEASNIVYYKNKTDNKYYDEDGNEADSSIDSKFMYNTMYYLKGDLKVDIGCFKNLPYNGSYTLSVLKAGGNIIDTSTGVIRDGNNLNPVLANELSTYTEQSSDIAGIYVTFLHTIVGSTYDGFDVHGISSCELEFEIFKDGNVILTKSIKFTEPSKETIPDENAFSVSRSDVNNTVSAGQDGTINMTIDTGFDSTLYPNYAYKVELYEHLDYYGNDSEKLYESDYTSSNEVEFTNIKNTNYMVDVTVYYVQDGNYIMCDSYNNIGTVNCPIVDNESSYSSSTGNYYSKYYIDTSYINPDYLNGNKLMSFKTGSIDLSDLGTSQSVASCTVTVTDEGNGIYLIYIESSNVDARRGNLVIEQGNSEIGYTEVTYSI